MYHIAYCKDKSKDIDQTEQDNDTCCELKSGGVGWVGVKGGDGCYRGEDQHGEDEGVETDGEDETFAGKED
jgi:hypothetical protein